MLFPVHGNDAEELGGRGVGEVHFLQVLLREFVEVSHAAAALVHEAVAVTVEEQIRHLERTAALSRGPSWCATRGTSARRPTCGLEARAVAEIDGLVQALGIRRVVFQHLGVAHVVARGEDDAFGGLQQHVAAIRILSDGARHALAFLVQLHAGCLEVELCARSRQVVADEKGRLLVAFLMEVGVGVQEELVAVVGDGVVVGLRLDAAGKRRLFPPGQRLLGVARPRLHLRGVGTPVALVVDERQRRP